MIVEGGDTQEKQELRMYQKLFKTKKISKGFRELSVFRKFLFIAEIFVNISFQNFTLNLTVSTCFESNVFTN